VFLKVHPNEFGFDVFWNNIFQPLDKEVAHRPFQNFRVVINNLWGKQRCSCPLPGFCCISEWDGQRIFRREEATLGQRIFMVVGLAAAFGAGYLAAAWQGNMLPWQGPSRRAVRSVPIPSDLAGVIRTLPNPVAPTQGGQQNPPTEGFPPVPAGDPAFQGDFLFAQSRFREAIPLYQKAVEANPKDVDSQNDLGLSLHYAGRSEEALKALRKGTETDPRYQRIWLTLGFVALQRNRLEEARGALNQAISIDPASGIADEARKFLQKIP
jgi:tetratricopeptide (TPR) repeat protein